MLFSTRPTHKHIDVTVTHCPIAVKGDDGGNLGVLLDSDKTIRHATYASLY